MKWKIEKRFPHQLNNYRGLVVTSNHEVFISNSRFALMKLNEDNKEPMDTNLQCNHCSDFIAYQHDRLYFVNTQNRPTWTDTKGHIMISSTSLPKYPLYLLALDENNDFYVLEGQRQLHIFDSHTLERKRWLTDPTKNATAFVVHHNIKYAITGDGIEMTNLESGSSTKMQIFFNNKKAFFATLQAITVDHKTRKLYITDSHSIWEILLIAPYRAQVIYETPYKEARSGPQEIIAMDGKVYVVECIGDNNMRVIVLAERIPWNVQRLLWIGNMNCDPTDCVLAKIPKELMKYIICIAQRDCD